jgi:hypothetical protein
VNLIIEVSLPDGQESSMRQLYAWLLDEDKVRREGKIGLSVSEIPPDGMGGTLDVIQFVSETVLSTASLIVAIAAWRQSQNPPPPIRISVETRTVLLDRDDPEAISEAAQQLDQETDGNAA